MTQLIGLIIVLFISGAVIAAMGDRLGTYIGKKRLSGFGLRPKHTAMLYTMLFGGLIAVLTQLSILAIDHDFRRALYQGNDLIRHNSELQSQVDTRQDLLKKVRKDLGAATNQEQIAAAKEKVAEDLRTKAENNLGLSKQLLAHTQLVLDHRQRLLGKQDTLLASSLRSLQAARQDLSGAQATLALTRQGLFNEKDSLTLATATVHAQQKRVADLEKRSSSLMSSIQNLTVENQTLVQEHDKLVLQPLIYSKGQEIGRTVLSTNQTYSDIRNQIVAFLEQLSQNALQLHGKLGKNGRAIIMLPYDVDEQKKYEPDNLTEDLTIDNLARGIQDSEDHADSVVLVGTAHINTFNGEQTEASILMLPNYLVYQKGTLISTATIDGSQPLDVIFGYLQQFLLHSVSPAAWKRGIIPVVGRNGDVSLGAATDSSQTLALMKQIQSIGSGAVVSAYAASDTYRNGPLHIKMTASPPAPSASPSSTTESPGTSPSDETLTRSQSN